MRRGEIWLVEYDFSTEAGEPAKTRPALVVSADRFNQTRAPTVVAVPLTTTSRAHPLHVEVDVAPLAGVSFAQVELVGVVSRRRLVHRLASVDELVMGEVSNLLAKLFDLRS